MPEYPAIAAMLQGPVLDLLRDTWVQLAIPFSQTGHYVRGLFEAESVEYPFEGSDLAVSLRNVVGYAAAVEFGHEAFHLPSRIRNWPHHSKKTGIGYMRVPFRHLTPGQGGSARAKAAMPAKIYEAARQLRDYASRQNPYRLTGKVSNMGNPKYFFVEGLAKQKAHHSASIYEGMIRNQQKGENASSSVYSTFRTITENSPGWNIPATEGQFFTKQVVEIAGSEVARMITDAAQQDVVAGIVTKLTAAGLQVSY